MLSIKAASVLYIPTSWFRPLRLMSEFEVNENGMLLNIFQIDIIKQAFELVKLASSSLSTGEHNANFTVPGGRDVSLRTGMMPGEPSYSRQSYVKNNGHLPLPFISAFPPPNPGSHNDGAALLSHSLQQLHDCGSLGAGQ